MRGQMTHLDTDVLAEFRAGLITGRRGTKVAAHLAVCGRCAALSGQLAEISALLAAIPAPTIPDSVVQRLDTVLAAERAGTDDSERAGGSSSRDRVTDKRPATHRRLRLVAVRVLAPAAAIAVLAAGGYGLSLIGGGPTQSASPGSVAAAKPSTGQVNGAASRPALIPAIRRSPGFNVVDSRTDYVGATLSQQLAHDVRTYAKAHPSQTPSAQLKACVSRVTNGVSPGVPVLVENAHFQGQPATVIVASSGDGYTAWVLAPGCSGTHGEVLGMTTLPGTSTP